MDFSSSQRQTKLVHDARALARQVLAKNADRYDRAASILLEAGYLGMLVPEAYGGWGLDLVTYALIMHELAQPRSGVRATI